MLELPVAVFTGMFLVGFTPLIFSVVFFLALILFTSTEEWGLAFVGLVAYSILMAIFTPTNPFMVVWHNPLDSIGFLIGYFVIGAGYSVVKYVSFVKKAVNLVKEAKLSFIENNKLTIAVTDEIPEELSRDWVNFRNEKLPSNISNKLWKGLRPSDQKELIVNWIAWWPFSAIGLFIADPLREIVNAIYSWLVGLYGKMYDRIVSAINVSDLK